MQDSPYTTYRAYMIRRYGRPLQRVPFDIGFGCPHRQGGGGGCTFCAPDGGRASQILKAGVISEQVETAIRFARERYHADRFMGYSQACTGTFASPETVQQQYLEILETYPLEALAIGTRPDCLPPPVMAMLNTLARHTELWIELGVQTTHDATLTRINRGHNWACSREAILKLAEAGIDCAVHLMLGLPGESTAQMLATAEQLAELPIRAVKLHNLHVLHETPLAGEYREAPFPVMDEHDYAELVIGVLRRLPAGIAIMRLQTDSRPETLIAPRWQMKKSQFTDYVVRRMRAGHHRQGDLAPPLSS